MYCKAVITNKLESVLKVRYSLGSTVDCWQNKSEQELSSLEDPEPQPHGPPQVREEGGQVEGQEGRRGHLHLV